MGQTMKRTGIIVVALAIGGWVALEILGAAWFARGLWDYYRYALPPLIWLFATSGILAWIKPDAARAVVMAVSAPAVIFSTLFFFGSLSEGIEKVYGWLLTAFEVVCIAAAGAGIGYLVGRGIRRPRAEMQPPGHS
jgi:hypothetical protein